MCDPKVQSEPAMIPSQGRHARDIKVLRTKIITSPFKYEHQLSKSTRPYFTTELFHKADSVGQGSAKMYLLSNGIALRETS